MFHKRNRILYFISLILIIILGLNSRKYPDLFPSIVNIYLGDALWSLMIFFGFGFMFPKKNTKMIALLSIFFCYIIELSQLYHGPFIDSIRETTIGGLVLGFGFLWSDLLAYAIGVGVGVFIEFLFISLGKRKNF